MTPSVTLLPNAVLVADCRVSRLTPNRQPQEHSYQDVSANAQATTVAITSTDPFIYNPKKGPAVAKIRPTIVQNELAEVFVTLQNPFLFELEIQSIGLRYVPLCSVVRSADGTALAALREYPSFANRFRRPFRQDHSTPFDSLEHHSKRVS